MRLKTWRGSKPLAIGWLLLISILCFLPGSALPKEDWLDKISFDKWVHFGLFATLLFLWRFETPHTMRYAYILFGLSIVYAFMIEIIQHYFIPNRSFDLFDVVADIAGSLAGLWFWAWVYTKK